MLLSQGLSEGADKRLTHRLAFIKVEPSITISICLSEGFFYETGELRSHPFHILLLHLGSFVDEVVEHQLFVKVDTDELSWRSLHNILDALGEASLDLNVHLHVDCLCGLRVDLETPDEDLGFVLGRAHQELVAFTAFLSHDHGRWVDEAQDLGDAFLTTWMRVKYLLNRWLLIVWIDVPNLKLSVECADQEVIFVDLVQEGWVLVIFNLVLNGPVPRFDIDVTDQYLLAIEARNGENR